MAALKLGRRVVVRMTDHRTAACSCCGTVRPLSELNGWDPITGDTSHAHCQRIAECDSSQARDQIGWVADQLDDHCPTCAGTGLIDCSDAYGVVYDSVDCYCRDCETDPEPERDCVDIVPDPIYGPICPICDGTGEVEQVNDLGYETGFYTCCDSCGGSGDHPSQLDATTEEKKENDYRPAAESLPAADMSLRYRSQPPASTEIERKLIAVVGTPPVGPTPVSTPTTTPEPPRVLSMDGAVGPAVGKADPDRPPEPALAPGGKQ